MVPRKNSLSNVGHRECLYFVIGNHNTHTYTHICHKHICLVPDYNPTWDLMPKGGWNWIRNYLNVCISMKTLVLLWTWITEGKGILLFLFYLLGLVLNKGPRATGKSFPGSFTMHHRPAGFHSRHVLYGSGQLVPSESFDRQAAPGLSPWSCGFARGLWRSLDLAPSLRPPLTRCSPVYPFVCTLLFFIRTPLLERGPLSTNCICSDRTSK